MINLDHSYILKAYRTEKVPVLGTCRIRGRMMQIGAVLARYQCENSGWCLLVRPRHLRYTHVEWVPLKWCSHALQQKYRVGQPDFVTLRDISSDVLPDDVDADLQFINSYLVQQACQLCTRYHISQAAIRMNGDATVTSTAAQHVPRFVEMQLSELELYLSRLMDDWTTDNAPETARTAWMGDIERYCGILTEQEAALTLSTMACKDVFRQEWSKLRRVLQRRGERLVHCYCPVCCKEFSEPSSTAHEQSCSALIPPVAITEADIQPVSPCHTSNNQAVLDQEMQLDGVNDMRAVVQHDAVFVTKPEILDLEVVPLSPRSTATTSSTISIFSIVSPVTPVEVADEMCVEMCPSPSSNKKTHARNGKQ